MKLKDNDTFVEFLVTRYQVPILVEFEILAVF